jgi:hypothetical protein
MLKTRRKRFVVLCIGALCLLATAGAGAASAQPEDTWAPPTWAASSKSTTFADNTVGLTVTCTTNTASGKSIGSGPDVGALAMTAPKFSNCQDSFGGSDTVTTAKSGWTISFVSDSADPGCPAGTGNDESSGADCVVLGVPQNAATIAIGAIPGCTITVASSGATTVGATMADPGGTKKNTFTLSGQSLAYTATGCPLSGGTAQFSGVYTLSAPNKGVLVDNS